MKTFREYLNEVKYKKTLRMNSRLRDIEILTKPIYEGKKYKLHQEKKFFVLTDIDDNILFYIEYDRLNRTYLLGSRENVSKEKDLFFKVIYTLLFLGYSLKEDFQHNDLSIKSIKKLIDNKVINVLYDGKDITLDIINNNFDDGDINKTFTYELDTRDTKQVLESRVHMFIEEDLFETVEFYIANTIF